MKRFQDYKVFRDSHSLNLRVYDATGRFPRHELFGLTSQMRRAASSIPMNIAEGSVKSEREFRQSLRIGLGSAAELEYQLLMARDLGYMDESEHSDLSGAVIEIRKMLTAFIRTIDRAIESAGD
ncbi:MAG: four helix bundle protein [Dehalococcoidia bacterium]|nr:four helix bundle protein [Dehalococcoidia bacterium]